MIVKRRSLIRLGSTFNLLIYMLALILMVDPTGLAWGVTLSQQYLLSLLFLVGMSFHVVSGLKSGMTWQFFSLTLFFLFSFFGAVYYVGVLLGEAAESFLRISIPMVAFFSCYLMFSNRTESIWFSCLALRASCAYSVYVAIAVIVWLIGVRYADVLHVFHEEIFLLGASAVALSKLVEFKVSVLFLLMLFLIGCLGTFKITGGLVALLSGAMIFRVYHLSSFDFGVSGRRLIKTVLYIVVSVLLLSLISLVVVFIDVMPKGSSEIRMFTYMTRFDQFLENPIFGLLFVGSSNVNVDFYKMVIPSHSDLLDLLAFGGVVGCSLIFFPLASILRRSLNPNGSAYMLFHSMVVFLGLLVMLFNPFIYQPLIGMIFWVSVAYLVACLRWSSGGWCGES